MSMTDLEAAFRMMKDHPDLMHFVGPRTEELVSTAEKAIGYTFPPTFRRFVLELGAGSFGATEIYGVINSDFTHSAVPNGVWLTLEDRAQGWIPPSYFEIYDTGVGSKYCLDLAKRDDQGECPVFEFYPGLPSVSQPTEPVAPDFGTLLLHLVQEELEDRRALGWLE